MKTLWDRYKQPIKIILGVGALALVLRGIDWQSFLREARAISPVYIAWFIVLQFISVGFSVQKWRRLSEVRGLFFSFWPGFRAYMLGMFLNNFFPGTVGGDFYRATWLGQATHELKRSFYSVLFDRVQGLLITVLMGFIAGTLSFWRGDSLFLSLYLSTAATTLVGFTLLYIFLYRVNADARWLIHPLFQKTLKSIQEDAKKNSWLPGTWWSVLFFLTGPGLANYVLFLSLGITLPFFPFLFLTAVISILMTIPITIGNLGVKEGLYALLFLSFGVSAEQAVLVVLLSRSLQLILSCVALPSYLSEKRFIRSTQS